jgi:hypothetical protein
MELSVKCASGFDQWSDHRSTSSCLEYSFVFFLSVFLYVFVHLYICSLYHLYENGGATAFTRSLLTGNQRCVIRHTIDLLVASVCFLTDGSLIYLILIEMWVENIDVLSTTHAML